MPEIEVGQIEQSNGPADPRSGANGIFPVDERRRAALGPGRCFSYKLHRLPRPDECCTKHAGEANSQRGVEQTRDS